MPISFDRNVLTESFDKVFFLDPHFELGRGNPVGPLLAIKSTWVECV